MTTAPRRFATVPIALLAGVFVAAVALRAWDWPRRYDVRDVDEVGYLSSSVCLAEGITPGYKPSPAGPQVWLGWAWVQAHVLWAEARPDPAIAGVPAKVRVFLAADRAFAGLYRDLSRMRQFVVAFNVAVTVAGCLAGVAYGWRAGGWAGAAVVGGVTAVCPLFVDYADQARPYAAAWAFGAMAMAAAVGPWRAVDPPDRRPGRFWFWATAILTGLAIGSRVEMLQLLPLLWWARVRYGGRRPRPAIADLIGLTAVAALTAYVVAPWLLTGLPGNLRAIATIQVANPKAAGVTAASTLGELAYDVGLGPVLVLFVAAIGLHLTRDRERWSDGLLAAIVLGLTATVFKATGFGLHHKGPALLAIVLGTATAVRGLVGRFRPVAVGAAVAVVVGFPLGRSLFALRATAGRPAAAGADWVEAHVPAGTTLYTHLPLLKVPLPTAAAADRIWGEVTAPEAAGRKFASGLQRFHLSADHPPRVLSEENLVQERGNVRRWYVLGTDVGPAGPRYDVRLIRPSPVFGVQDVAADFARTGGVVLWRPSFDEGPPPASWGPPQTVLHDADGDSAVYVFCSPELRTAVAAGN